MTADLMALLSDPQEGPLLRPLLGDPADEDARTRYAAWLTERGDPRAALFTMAAWLARGDLSPEEHAALAARYEELRAEQDWRWLSCVLPQSRLLNCGRGPAAEPQVRFAYECDRSWEVLQPTGDLRVRYCDGCQQQVHLCRDRQEAQRHALRGACIAIDSRLAQSVRSGYEPRFRHMLGRPDAFAEWARDIFAPDQD